MTSATVAKIKPPELLWDYSCIENEAPVEIIQSATSQIKTVFRRTLENIIEIGKLLKVVRENIPHGSWGDWLVVELDMSASSACNYLRAYEHRDEFRAIDKWTAGAAFLLTGPSAPDDAIETANQLAESGQKVTKAEAAEILHGTTDPTAPAAEPDNEHHLTDIDHDQDRTRQAPESTSEPNSSKLEIKYAVAVWAAAAKLAELNAGGCAVVLLEAQKEAQQFAELSLGDDGRPCRDTLKSFLDGGRRS